LSFWDNPRLLDRTSNGLFVAAGLMAAWFAGNALVHSNAFPLRSIRLQGELQHVSRMQAVEALQGRVSGTFFTVDLDGLRRLFETIPWVRRAEVRRLWPDRLEVTLEEHVAIARWGRREEDRLVNRQGELFTARSDADLPLLAGPAGSEREVAGRYAEFRALLAPLGLAPRQVLLSDRRAWQLRLDSGLLVQLGRDAPRDPVHARLARFVEAYPRTLGGMDRRLEYVDLRYPNGFALRVPGMGALKRGEPGARPPA
jgi:cell division protein FtsQ